MRKLIIEGKSFEHLQYWSQQYPSIHRKILEMIPEILRTPFEGTGKPEPLRHDYKGYWSRRITKQHRIIYKVKDDAIIITALYEHYTL